MTMMKGSGPFGESPGGVFNFEVPAHEGRVLYFEECPRRVRVELAGAVVADSRRVKLLHETGLLPVYYFPEDDVRSALLRPSERRTRCPFKGEARYYAVAVGDHVAENAVWTYPEPLPDAPPLAGYLAFYWNRMERWLEEDEEVFVHPRDPYHRIDVLRSSRRVRVRIGGEIVADTAQPRILFETGLRPRFYISPADVREEALHDSDTRTRCPYKGRASYKRVRAGSSEVADAAWFYPEPLRDAQDVRGWLCFYEEHPEIELQLD